MFAELIVVSTHQERCSMESSTRVACSSVGPLGELYGLLSPILELDTVTQFLVSDFAHSQNNKSSFFVITSPSIQFLPYNLLGAAPYLMFLHQGS